LTDPESLPDVAVGVMLVVVCIVVEVVSLPANAVSFFIATVHRAYEKCIWVREVYQSWWSEPVMGLWCDSHWILGESELGS